VRPFMDVSQLSVVGVVVRPPREDPRDSVLPDAEALPVAPSPAPLGGSGTAEDSGTGSDGTSTPSATPEQETPATIQPTQSATPDEGQ
jgi:rod shape-determining protein MreC